MCVLNYRQYHGILTNPMHWLIKSHVIRVWRLIQKFNAGDEVISPRHYANFHKGQKLLILEKTW